MIEEHPRDRVFWFLEMVALGFVLAAVDALFRGEFATVLTAMALAFVFGNFAFHWKDPRWIAGTVVAAACIGTLFCWWSSRKGFVIEYGGTNLNGRTIQLIVPAGDRTVEIHQMLVWPPEAPKEFSLSGVTLRNSADMDLQPSVAWLSFNAPIEKWQENMGPWRRSADGGVQGWTSYRFDFPRGRIEAGTAPYLEEFSGKPIPSGPLKVRLTLNWASKTTTADFTLMPPSAQTQAR